MSTNVLVVLALLSSAALLFPECQGQDAISNYVYGLIDQASQTFTTVPDINDSFNFKGGKIKWEVKNIVIDQLTHSQNDFSLTADATTGAMTLTLDHIYIKLDMDWKVTFKNIVKNIRKSGGVVATFSDLDISITGTVDLATQSVTVSSCSDSIGPLNLNFSGSSSWILDAAKNPIENKVKNAVDGKLCQIITNYINNL